MSRGVTTRAHANPAAQAACFVAGTPLLTRDGSRRIEDFRVGDRILSRSEHNLTGPLSEKVVEQSFIRSAPIISLRVQGKDIRTTREHPFYLEGRGWVCAGELSAGNRLASHDGQWVTVEAVTDLNEVATVYNLRVSDYHTYFVGSASWGFSVWAHNATYLAVSEGNLVRLYQVEGNTLRLVETTHESLDAARRAVGATGTVIEVPRGIVPTGNLSEVIRFERRIGEAILAEGNAVVIAGDRNVQNFFRITSGPIAEHVSISSSGRLIISEGKRAATAAQVEHVINQLRNTAEYVRRAAPGAQIETLEFVLASEATLPSGFSVVNNQLVQGSQAVAINGIPVTVRRIPRT